jgi:hypothetical protein
MLWPRLASIVALCRGGYRLSKRRVVSFCREEVGIALSVGEMCQIEPTVVKAVAPAGEEAALSGQSGERNIEETPWQERPQRRTWWPLGPTQLRVFPIATGRGAAVLQKLVGNW